MTIIVAALLALSGVCHLVAVLVRDRGGNAKLGAAIADAGKVLADAAQAIPAGKAAAIAVVVKDLEDELVKLAPDSKVVAILERLKLVVEAAQVSK